MLGNLIRALRAGQELKDPAKWKSRQNTINAVTAILVFGFEIAAKTGIVQVHLDDSVVVDMATGIAAVLFSVNMYLTTATTKKIGTKQGGK